MLRKVSIKFWYTRTVLLLEYWNSFFINRRYFAEYIVLIIPTFIHHICSHLSQHDRYFSRLPWNSKHIILGCWIYLGFILKILFMHNHVSVSVFLCIYNLFVIYLDPWLVHPMTMLGRHLLAHHHYIWPWLFPTLYNIYVNFWFGRFSTIVIPMV